MVYLTNCQRTLILVALLGFEPRLFAFKVRCVANSTKEQFGCGGWDLNPQFSAYEADEITISLPRNIGGKYERRLYFPIFRKEMSIYYSLWYLYHDYSLSIKILSFHSYFDKISFIFWYFLQIDEGSHGVISFK